MDSNDYESESDKDFELRVIDWVVVNFVLLKNK